MNGCKREGGKNPELQVTDHGSDTACMQTGRGRGERKNCIASERKKKKREINHTLKNKIKKSMTNKREEFSSLRLGSRKKL